MATALAGVERESIERMIVQLAIVKENLRQAIAARPTGSAGELRYG